LLAEGDEQARGEYLPSTRQGVEQGEVWMVLGPLGNGLVELFDGASRATG
jgi:hypothetical protein